MNISVRTERTPRNPDEVPITCLTKVIIWDPTYERRRVSVEAQWVERGQSSDCVWLLAWCSAGERQTALAAARQGDAAGGY